MTVRVLHSRRPYLLGGDHGYIGQEPSATHWAEPALSSLYYLKHWAQQGQIFTYSGPPDDTINDTPGTTYATHDATKLAGSFYVILQGTSKFGAPADRHLAGALLPWKFNAWWNGSSWDHDVAITWQQNGYAASDLFREQIVSPNYDQMGYNVDLPPKIKPWKLTGTDFSYIPDAGGYSWGCLGTEGIQTAALGIWTSPDHYLSASNARYIASTGHAYIASGRAIRGYTGNQPKSLGDMIHEIGDTASTEDALNWATERCLFQWGHPRGVYSESNSYAELCANARYRVWPQNYREQPNTEVTTVHPLIVATSGNATSGDKAYVKITSLTSLGATIDTWEVGFYDNTTSLYKYSDGTGSDGLDINAHDCSFLKIEMKAPNVGGTGTLKLHTVALWQPPEW